MRKGKHMFGSQSAPCPHKARKNVKRPCGAPTRVLRTTRVGAHVIRERVCTNDHRFTTEEKPSDV